MSERTPVKSLFDLKMTSWYLSRKPIIQEAINNYPPGYYIFSGNSETYKLIGWSEPEEKKGETDVHVYLERDRREGTERLRIHPQYMIPEEDIVEIEQIQEVHLEPAPTITGPIGYNVGRSIDGNIRFLMLPNTGDRRLFTSISSAQDFLLQSNMATEEQLTDFIYEPVYA